MGEANCSNSVKPAALVTVEKQERHRYFRLANEDVAGLLESLMGVAFRTGAMRIISSPRDPALRRARICYDHLAGEVGVTIYESLTRHRALTTSEDGLRLTPSGEEWFASMGVNTHAAARQRRTFCRPCMDWSERRFHLAGALGAALLSRFRELGWVKIEKHSRVVRITPVGDRELRSTFIAVDRK